MASIRTWKHRVVKFSGSADFSISGPSTGNSNYHTKILLSVGPPLVIATTLWITCEAVGKNYTVFMLGNETSIDSGKTSKRRNVHKLFPHMLNKIFLLRFKLKFKFKPDETMKFTSPKNIISSDITFFSTFLLINTWMDGWITCTKNARATSKRQRLTSKQTMLLLLLLISSYDPYASSSFTSVDKPQVNPQNV